MKKSILARAFAAAVALVSSTAPAGVNSWTLSGPDGGNATSVAISPGDADVMLAQTQGGFYRSTDGGAHWSYVAGGGSIDSPAANGAIVFDPTDPSANRRFTAALGR